MKKFIINVDEVVSKRWSSRTEYEMIISNADYEKEFKNAIKLRKELIKHYSQYSTPKSYFTVSDIEVLNYAESKGSEDGSVK